MAKWHCTNCRIHTPRPPLSSNLSSRNLSLTTPAKKQSFRGGWWRTMIAWLSDFVFLRVSFLAPSSLAFLWSACYALNLGTANLGIGCYWPRTDYVTVFVAYSSFPETRQKRGILLFALPLCVAILFAPVREEKLVHDSVWKSQNLRNSQL